MDAVDDVLAEAIAAVRLAGYPEVELLVMPPDHGPHLAVDDTWALYIIRWVDAAGAPHPDGSDYQVLFTSEPKSCFTRAAVSLLSKVAAAHGVPAWAKEPAV